MNNNSLSSTSQNQNGIISCVSQGFNRCCFTSEQSETDTNPIVEAINGYSPAVGKQLRVKKINDKEQLETTSNTLCAPLKKINYFIMGYLSLDSLIGSIFKNIDDYLGGEDDNALLAVARFLKANEDEISGLWMQISPFQKEILKMKLLDLENRCDIQFTFIEQLFGKRTEPHNHHQAKMRGIIDECGITKSDISRFNLDENGNYLSDKTDAEIQQSISKIFQQCILPIYKSPMPKISTLQVKKEDYIRTEIVNNGRVIPHKTVRCWHDSMHAGRVAFWTQVLIEIFKKYGRDSVPNKILSAVGGGFHDSAREHEGTDHWDEESSFLFDHFLTNLGMTPEDRKDQTFPLAQKDPRGGKFTSDEQRVLHDADCVDINRCCGGNFDPNYLCFYKFDDVDFNKAQFIEEAKDFIEYTQDQELKYLFENESPDFYGDLVRLLFKLEEMQPGRFKIITSLIETPMACYRESKDNDFISKIINLRKNI